MLTGNALTDEQVEELTGLIQEVYDYDFTGYSMASLKRRVNRLYALDGFYNYQDFQKQVINSKPYFNRFVEEVTVNVTEMFRDPGFYLALRKQVLPILNTYPLIRIWVAGCSTGEEAYSIAILLEELKLRHKSIIYATDINNKVLNAARQAQFPLNHMQLYSSNYIHSGGQEDFSVYYTADYNMAKFNNRLKEKIVFSSHNLVSDYSFNSFQLILCRNVLIYFDRAFQEKAFTLFNQSLEPLGFLGLGSKETLSLSSNIAQYTQLGNEKIWRKKV